MKITDYIKTTLKPAVYANLDKLPEFARFEFCRGVRRWESPYKLDGQPARKPRKDKTISLETYKNLFENGHGGVSYVDFVMENENLDFFQAVNKLAASAGCEKYESNGWHASEKDKFFDACNKFFQQSMKDVLEGKNNGKQAAQALEYLHNVRRFTNEQIKQARLGYFPGRGALATYLENNGYNRNEALNLIAKYFRQDIGDTHRIAITIKSGWQVKGFCFREDQDNKGKDKYYYNSGEGVGDAFMFIPGLNENDGRMLIVEGVLDAVSAGLAGFNCDGCAVAIGNAIASEKQFYDALERGYRDFYLCLDYETGLKENGKSNEEQTKANIENSAKHFTAAVKRTVTGARAPMLHIVTLKDTITKPDGSEFDKIDADLLVRTLGTENNNALNALKNAVNSAVTFQMYEFTKEYETIVQEAAAADVGISQPLFTQLRDKVISILSDIDNKQQREDFWRELRYSVYNIEDEDKGIGLDKDYIFKCVGENDAATAAKLEQEAAEARKADLLTGLRNFQAQFQAGKIDEDVLQRKMKELFAVSESADNSAKFREWAAPITRAEHAKHAKEMPEAVPSGFILEDSRNDKSKQSLDFPGGAITIIAANPGHCKTTFLLNSCLNIIEQQHKPVLFVGYEESRDKLTNKILNLYINERFNGEGINNLHALEYYYKHDKFSNKFDFSHIEQKKFIEMENQFYDDFINKQLVLSSISGSTRDLQGFINHIRKAVDTAGNIGAVFVDYIQLLKLDGADDPKSRLSRYEQLKVICVEYLKEIARETGLPLVLGAQFNRQAQSPEECDLNNIGEAGDIERIASLVAILWNNQKNKRDAIPAGLGGWYKIDEMRNTIYCAIRKNREGESGVEGLFNFYGNTGKITNSVIPGGKMRPDNNAQPGSAAGKHHSSTAY